MSQDANPIELEKLLDAPIDIVWRAIAERDVMKQWYFDVPAFEARVGALFEFSGGPPERQYRHLCEVLEVVPGKVLAYSWRYDGYAGNSRLRFELFDKGENTLLRLSHTGIPTFPADNPDFAIGNFAMGWDAIINTELPKFLTTYAR